MYYDVMSSSMADEFQKIAEKIEGLDESIQSGARKAKGVGTGMMVGGFGTPAALGLASIHPKLKALRHAATATALPGAAIGGIGALQRHAVKRYEPAKLLAAKALQGEALTPEEQAELFKRNPSGSTVIETARRADALTEGKQRKELSSKLKELQSGYKSQRKAHMLRQAGVGKQASSKAQAQMADEAFKLLKKKFPDMGTAQLAGYASKMGREGRPGIVRRLVNAFEAPGSMTTSSGNPVILGGKEYRKRFAAEIKRKTPGKHSAEETVRQSPDLVGSKGTRGIFGQMRAGASRQGPTELGSAGAIPAVAPV